MEGITRVLALNCGSSGLKWSLLSASDGSLLDGGHDAWPAGEDAVGAATACARAVVRRMPHVGAIGHRLVHGGRLPSRTICVDKEVRAELSAAAGLDPLHMRPALAALTAVEEERPGIPQVAIFDTTFHRTLPDPAATYALPHAWTSRWDLRRRGFHGLSVAWAVRRATAMLGGLPPRLIVCHLGSGCSVTAVRDGDSVDTTMGFTPMEGLVMASRSGSVDPGLVLQLQLRHGLTARQVWDGLSTASGLLGVSGISGDLRDVLAAADEGLARPRLAYDQFIRSIHLALGGMAAVLGGVDAVVFTGGIGEHVHRVRSDAAAPLGYAGIRLDEHANRSAEPDTEIARQGSTVRVLVIHAREDLIMLDEILSAAPARPEVSVG